MSARDYNRTLFKRVDLAFFKNFQAPRAQLVQSGLVVNQRAEGKNFRLSLAGVSLIQGAKRALKGSAHTAAKA